MNGLWANDEQILRGWWVGDEQMTIDCLLADYWLTTDMIFGCICDFFEIAAYRLTWVVSRDASASKNVIIWVKIKKHYLIGQGVFGKFEREA